MFQKYNTSTIVTKFIKELLRTSYIPTVPVWNLGDPLIAGSTYIAGGNIVKAIKNASAETLSPSSYVDPEFFKIIGPYIEGKFYNGITSNFESNSSYYDSATHRHLGDFIRAYKDLHNIDLMPFYNCWSGTYANYLRLIRKDSSGGTYNIQVQELDKTVDDGYKVLVVPIRFNTDYTIYINSSMPTRLLSLYSTDIEILDPTNSQFEGREIIYSSYTQPIIYKVEKTAAAGEDSTKSTDTLEKYLTLLIQVPNSVKTPIVILEGNYKENRLFNFNSAVNQSCAKVFNYENFNLWSQHDIINYFQVIPSLLYTLSSESFAFSDRLVEYLVWNIICPDDPITQNTQRIQQYISSPVALSKLGKIYSQNKSIPGVWDSYLRIYIYDLVKNFKYPKYLDINGYIDKDSEEILVRGKE